MRLTIQHTVSASLFIICWENLEISQRRTLQLVAGHRGGGKTTELRRLEQKCAQDYTVVWVNTDTALDKFNTGHAEVAVLIAMQVVQRLKDVGWKLP